jgi:quinol monooxygenase YgiN
MIALSVSMTFAPEDFAEVREHVKGMIELSRKDEGCVEYWWAESLTDENTLYLYEVWEGPEVFQAHLAQPYELDWMANQQPKVKKIEVRNYDPTTVTLR